MEINLEDPTAIRGQVETLCATIRGKIAPLQAEIAGLEERRRAAIRDADTMEFKRLKVRESDLHEQIFELAASEQKRLSQETQALENLLGPHLNKLTADTEDSIASRRKLINGYDEALPVATKKVEQAELRHASFAAALGSVNDVLFTLNRELAALINSSSEGIAA
jgi:hypothetical protein